MLAGDLDVSYIIINPSIVFGTTCAFVKPAKLLVGLLPVIWLPSWIFSANRRSTKSEVLPLERKLDPENIYVAV